MSRLVLTALAHSVAVALSDASAYTGFAVAAQPVNATGPASVKTAPPAKAVAVGSAIVPAPAKAAQSVKTAMSAISAPSATAAQCTVAPSSSLVGNS